jgi:putative inorganic carbon (HCO3(-)) transporter
MVTHSATRESYQAWLSRFFVVGVAVAIATLIAFAPLVGSALLIFGIILVIVVLLEPRWGLYLLPFTVPFGSIREINIGPATVGGTEALLGLFLAAWLAQGVVRRTIRLTLPPLTIPFALWYGVMALSVLNSLSLADSLKELIKWGEVFAVYAIAAQELRRRDIAIVIGTTLAAGTLAALEGIYQSVFRVGPDGFLFPLAGRVWLRAYGRFIQPNPYAGYLGLVLPLGYSLLAVAIGLGTQDTGRKPQDAGTATADEGMVGAGHFAQADSKMNPPTRPPLDAEKPSPLSSRIFSRTALLLMVGGCVAIIGAALFLTLSRGAWIGAVGAAVVIGALLSRRALVASLFGGITLLLTFALAGTDWLPPALAERATDFLPYINVINVNVRGVEITDANFAVIERLAHWQAAYEMWADKPWLGQGVGNYAAVYPAYYIPPWTEALGHAHNLFLNTLAETGVIGLIAYLLFWGQAVWLTIQATLRSSGLWRGVAVGTLGVLVHLHAHNFFDNLYVHGMYLHVALMLAIAAILSNPSPVTISDRRGIQEPTE